ncbi:hypothetical protein EDEG_01668 [Edhazardia aedis USNM 41457]|uniref:Uncharacterized protein n=1 Tax=Edhazardia aedis (strain USNM 41457) TaxID=1003232 RepID=J9D958_EDHAE|nr:hypothetical protein EDEG_01668 [Edhazardia aedis USNM 41457]|eukprot:EJW04034.1 hypothetical protein EDEG_01668 [Edhazardia aedis USNM 41457]
MLSLSSFFKLTHFLFEIALYHFKYILLYIFASLGYTIIFCKFLFNYFCVKNFIENSIFNLIIVFLEVQNCFSFIILNGLILQYTIFSKSYLFNTILSSCVVVY